MQTYILQQKRSNGFLTIFTNKMGLTVSFALTRNVFIKMFDNVFAIMLNSGLRVL